MVLSFCNAPSLPGIVFDTHLVVYMVLSFCNAPSLPGIVFDTYVSVGASFCLLGIVFDTHVCWEGWFGRVLVWGVFSLCTGYCFRYPCLREGISFWVLGIVFDTHVCVWLFLLGAGYRFRYPCWFLLIAFLLWKLPLLSRRNHSGGYRGGHSALAGGAPVGRLMGSAESF